MRNLNSKYQRKEIDSMLINQLKKNKKEKISYLVLNTENGYHCVKFYEANEFKIDESLVFMPADV